MSSNFAGVGYHPSSKPNRGTQALVKAHYGGGGELRSAAEDLNRKLEETTAKLSGETAGNYNDPSDKEISHTDRPQREKLARPLAEEYARLFGYNVNSSEGKAVVDKAVNFYSTSNHLLERLRGLVTSMQQ